MGLRAKFKKYDPAQILIRKYKLKGIKAEIVDLVVSLGIAALLYFVIMPAILGANPAAVVVQTCSMKGVFNVGDISVLQGTNFEDLNAPEIILAQNFFYNIEPNNVASKTTKLLFPDGQELAVQTTGDIITYNSQTSGMQIIHRVIAKVRAEDGNFLITKGDVNDLPDSVKISCAEYTTTDGKTYCTKLSTTITEVCDAETDRGWPGCLAAPLQDKDIVGKHILWIPFLGHVKMLFMHVVTLGHGYPGPFWC